MEEGDPYYDFRAQDQKGKVHRLSEYKGKYILLDFSSTYCGPCVESIPELKKLSKNYDKDLKVITFSCDGGKEVWFEGLKRDKPDWLNLWDGKGYYGETIIKYGITGNPTFILIDPSGKIVSKSTGFYSGQLQKVVGKFISNSSK